MKYDFEMNNYIPKSDLDIDDESLEQITDLYQFLLTAEQEATAREKIPGWPKYKYHLSDGQSNLAIFGFAHATTLEETKPIVEALLASNANLVLVEGMGDQIAKDILAGKMSDIKNLPDDQKDPVILKRFQEQVYIAYKALSLGKEVRSWDLNPSQQLVESLRGASLEDHQTQLEYYLYMGVLKLLEMHQIPTAEGIIQLISNNFSLSHNQLTEIGLTSEQLIALSPKPIEEITLKQAVAQTDPNGKGPVNQVLHDLNIARDRHAIDVFAKVKKFGKNVFITGGSSHALTWEPALRELYKRSQSYRVI